MLKNRLIALSAASFLALSCEQGVFCTEEFRSVGFVWTGSSLPDSVYTVNSRTGDTLTALDKGYETYFAVVDDSHMQSLATTVPVESSTVVRRLWSLTVYQRPQI